MTKATLWLLQLPLIALATAGYVVSERSASGRLEAHFLRDRVAPRIEWVRNLFTDAKFKLRGEIAPKHKIVIVEVDSPTLDAVGRWPWHRDATAQLIESVFEAGAKVVGLDMVFSEPDTRLSPELSAFLQNKGMGAAASRFETDPALTATIARHRDRLVLGWTSESVCVPGQSKPEECPVTLPEAIATLPPDFSKFGYDQKHLGGAFDPARTPLHSVVTVLGNLPDFNAAAAHAGYFNAFPDGDAFIRRSPLVMLANGVPHPSLPLAMARVGLGEKLSILFDEQSRFVREISFAGRGQPIPVNPLGVLEINFRGGERTFDYVSALDLLSPGDTIQDALNQRLTGRSKAELLRDAYVLIGVSAIGVYDMRSFPFATGVPGVDGHAHALDTILSGDALVAAGDSRSGSWPMLALLILGGLCFAFLLQRLESVPAVALSAALLAGFGLFDVYGLFSRGHNWATGFLYLEAFALFVVTMAAKYVAEERNKKFIRGAFTKYVAPAVVDSILKDPTKLSLGGERRAVTILFSDIRSFTTFSEKMEPKALAGFLNDYLTIMTDLVFGHEGTLDKYIGDAVMAFWGAPLDQPHHARNAAKSAIAMMRALDQNHARFLSQYGIDVRVGIGLNTGEVSVGNMGSQTNFEYTVIGDHVNLASRIEGLTKAYRVSILTTRFTLDSMRGAGDELPSHRVLDLVKVKGKTQAIELIELLHRESTPAEGLRAFAEGRERYAKRDWQAAIASFTRASELLAPQAGGPDGPSEIMIERCREFAANPPAADWTGEWQMTEK